MVKLRLGLALAGSLFVTKCDLKEIGFSTRAVFAEEAADKKEKPAEKKGYEKKGAEDKPVKKEPVYKKGDNVA